MILIFQFGFNMFPEIPRPFNTQYKCFSVSMLPGNERDDVERGGKSNYTNLSRFIFFGGCGCGNNFNINILFSVIMPPSALDTLTRLNIVYPMLFKLTNKKTNRITHSGVLEFVADEGKVYLPYWVR